MIRALGEFLMRGWLQAVVALTALTLVSLFLVPLSSLLSGAPTGLVTLRRGPRAGMEVVLGAAGLLALVGWVSGPGPLLALAFVVSVWLPVWVSASVLRRTESQAAAVLAAAGLASVFAVSMYVAVPDVAGWWRGWLDAWLQQTMSAAEVARLSGPLDTVAPLLNAMMATATLVSVVLAVLSARAWQALLFNPGGFAREFQALRMPRTLVLPLAVAGAAVVALDGIPLQVARDLLVLGLAVFLFHGIAAVHRTVSARHMNRGWLIGMYVLMFVLPQVALFVACIGMADAWLGQGERPGET